jgi:hypothetical protein
MYAELLVGLVLSILLWALMGVALYYAFFV